MMPLRILIVPDKFKGTLTAQAAARLIAQGWQEVRPGDSVELLPMSDGGDGFGEVLAGLLQLEPRLSRTFDAAQRPCESTWWWGAEKRLALIESARVIGLALLPPGQFHPFQLDTFGLGALIHEALALGARECCLGIGGSATNDGGFGLARALGWRFVSRSGAIIEQWTQLAELAHVEPPQPHLSELDLRVAVDVQNPLLGPTGASRVYGPQKGLKPEDLPLAEAGLARLAEVVQQDLGIDAASDPGTGAAGGLGFGLRCFLQARLESGFDLFARLARVEERIQSSDLVITGEGAIDASTLMGKGVGQLARLCQKHHVPCIGVAGALGADLAGQGVENPFSAVYGIVPQLTSPESAMRQPDLWLPRLAAAAARAWA